MRFNVHSHIFNFRSVFTEETIGILVRRLSNEGWPAFATDAAESLIQKHIKAESLTEDALVRELASGIKTDKALKKLLQDNLSKLPPSVSVALNGDFDELPIGALKEILGKVGAAIQQSADDDARIGDISDLLSFLAIGLKSSIREVAAKLLEYTPDDTALVTLTLDITAGGDDDDALYQGQLKETARAALAYPGRILPFVCVNPRRTLHYERMTYALEEQGYIGVKLYPSLGYSVDTPEMRRVYAYCQANEIPILQHCNQGGFCRDKGSARFCSPADWDAILADFPGLKVCFGHFGGVENLVVDPITPDSWTDQILGLMRKYPDSVYADISYHDSAMDAGDHEAAYFANLKRLLNDSQYASRILFGTDFHLIRQRVRDDNLWRFFEARFSDAHFSLLTEDNPAEFLGMPSASGRGSRGNIKRHLKFLAKYNNEVGQDPAPWVTKAITAEFGAVSFFPNPFGPNWTINNEAHFYTEQFFRSFMSDTALKTLDFTQRGTLRLRDLNGIPSGLGDAGLAADSINRIATRLQSFVEQKPNPGALLEAGISPTQARRAIVRVLSDPDSTIAAFGPLIDKLYKFRSENLERFI